MTTRNLELFYINRPLADLAALKAKSVAGLNDGLSVEVVSMSPYGGGFDWIAGSTATADDINVVLPTGHIGAGRWIRRSFDIELNAAGQIKNSFLEIVNLILPATTSTTGIIKFINSGFGDTYIHTYGGYASPYNNSNFFAGNSAGNHTNTAVWNHGIGNGTLVSLTSGQSNDGYGVGALTALNDGNFNSAFGPGTLGKLVHGSYNLGLGIQAGNNYTGTESSNVCIRNLGVLGESNTIRIGTQGTGNAQQNRAFIAGIYDTSIGATIQPCAIDSDGQLGASKYSYHPVTNSITAYAGGGQASATQLTSEINVITVCATLNDSVKFPVAVAGMLITIKNKGAQTANVYPQSGSYIDGTVDLAYPIGNSGSARFVAIDSTHWESL